MSMYGMNPRGSKNSIHFQLQNSIQNNHGQRKLSPVSNEEKETMHNNYIKNEDMQTISQNVSQSRIGNK